MLPLPPGALTRSCVCAPFQAVEHGHRQLAEALATRAGNALPLKPIRSLLTSNSARDVTLPPPQDATVAAVLVTAHAAAPAAAEETE